MSDVKSAKEKLKETPTKTKQTEETVNCSRCSVIFAKKDAPRHKIWCFDASGDHINSNPDEFFSVVRSIPEKGAHGFIHARRLFGPLIKEFPAPNEFLRLPCSRSRERLIFVNSKSMSDCGLKIGNHVTIGTISGDCETVAAAVVWPSSKVPLFSVGIPKTNFAKELSAPTKSYCLISKIFNLKRAVRIRLIPAATVKSFRQSEDFLRAAHAYLKGSCLKKPVDAIRIPYFGQVCTMEATTTAVDASEIKVFENSDASLTDRLSALELDDSKDTINYVEENVSRTSTPMRSGMENGTSTPIPGTPGNTSFIHFPSWIADQSYVLVEESTELVVETEKHGLDYRPGLNFGDLGGMERTKEILCDHVSVCLCQNDGGGKGVKSILLYGMAGCGKTSLAEAASAEVGANFLRLDSSIIGISDDADAGGEKDFSDFETALRIAEQHPPCVVLLDDLENISEKAKKNLSVLSSWMEKLMKSSMRICVIGATSAIERLSPSFRKRFQFEIEVPIPTAADRKLIIQKMLGKNEDIAESGVEMLADRTHGFTPSDLNILFKEAVVVAHKRLKHANPIRVELKDFQAALTSVRPSAMREIFVEVPKVRWSDVGGNDEVKLKLQQAVEWPLQHPEKFAELGIKPPTGILMYGPPGCSKTMIAKALATESGLNFLSVKGPEIFSKWVGESERAVRDLFRKARQVAPSVIFFDEIDAIGSERSGAGVSGSSSNVSERVLAQMLTEMDGIQPLTNVTIVAATNRPDVIDRALLRPGRLDISIYVRLPDKRTREQILKLELAKKRIAQDVDVADLVEKSDRYTGAELVALCNEAGLMALSEDRMVDAIYGRHFEKALSVIKPRISDESLRVYERFEKSTAM